jgi:hypothetical protein
MENLITQIIKPTNALYWPLLLWPISPHPTRVSEL